MALVSVSMVVGCGQRSPSPSGQYRFPTDSFVADISPQADDTPPIPDMVECAKLVTCAQSHMEALLSDWQAAVSTGDSADLDRFANAHGNEALAWIGVSHEAAKAMIESGMSLNESINENPAAVMALLEHGDMMSTMRAATQSMPALASEEVAEMSMQLWMTPKTMHSPALTASDILDACDLALTPTQINHMLSNGPFVRSTLFGVDQ
ncbi:MAG: hypothetical protein QF471_04490 [Phycisphaerales bacterium]|nr:hypothetical protein [Phycisphaerales bacterium]